jgi:primase-polymerase (primpol)-like protein
MIVTSRSDFKEKDQFYGGEPPCFPAPHLDGIPPELRDVPVWVLWDVKRKGGKWTKVPLQLEPASKEYRQRTGLYFYRASTTDPAHGYTWERIIQAYKTYSRKCCGIGIILRDGLCGVDLDHAIKNGQVIHWAHLLVTQLDSFTD